MRVSDLYIHPIKSAAALAVKSLSYRGLGPMHDRNWMVVDRHGKFMSQRKITKMCLLEVDVSQDRLTLTAPGMPKFELVGASDRRLKVSVWEDDVTGMDCGDTVAHWLSDYFELDCRLVQVDEQTQRQVDTDFATNGELVAFADGFPTLIATTASLEEFNSHLDTPVDMRRFRPNIVIEGAEAYAEDHWRVIKIGDVVFNLVKPCSRCIMPSINPDTATKEMTINEALLRTRRGADGKTYFGQNALHRGRGDVSVGDSVEIIESA